MKEISGARQPDVGRLTGLGKNKVQSVKIHKGKRSATKRTEEKYEEENIEEGLAERQSLLRLGAEREFFDHLHYEEMQSDLEDLAQEELMRNELMRTLGALQVTDIALVDGLGLGTSFTKTRGFVKYLSLPLIILRRAKNQAAYKRILECSNAYKQYLDLCKKEITKLITEEFIEYSLSESAWQEIRANRYNPSLRSIAIEKIRTYALKHTISQRYAGSCSSIQVRELELKESNRDRDEIITMNPGQIKEALANDTQTKDKLFDRIGSQYMFDQIISREGGWKFQAKLATISRISAIITVKDLNLQRATCYNTLLVRRI